MEIWLIRFLSHLDTDAIMFLLSKSASLTFKQHGIYDCVTQMNWEKTISKWKITPIILMTQTSEYHLATFMEPFSDYAIEKDK